MTTERHFKLTSVALSLDGNIAVARGFAHHRDAHGGWQCAKKSSKLIRNSDSYIDAILFPDYISGALPGAGTVGKLHQIGKLIIRVYANDHLPPHFHAIAPDFEALIEVETLTIMRGRLPARARKAVMTWATRNRTLIAGEWNRINPRFPVA